QWTWLRAAGQLISDCISLWIMLAIARVFPYVLRSDGAKLTANDAQSLLLLNQVIQWCVICVAGIICLILAVHAFQTVRAVRRMVNQRRHPAAMGISQTL
ncbi:MAG TPA: hypothetical protein VFT65_05335, partial [Candidatus Angelobacter sp.]|nr:hypothetical protein [Candidatus Angelobacter sp.]